MKINKKLIRIILGCILLVGCGVADGGKVTARDVLKQSPDADIFQYNGFIYSNVSELEWFEEKKQLYTKQKLLTEIRTQKKSSFGFRNSTATKLPVGTKIYSASQNENDLGILIVELEGKELFYMKLIEG